jgi:hypothetical protein
LGGIERIEGKKDWRIEGLNSTFNKKAVVDFHHGFFVERIVSLVLSNSAELIAQH